MREISPTQKICNILAKNSGKTPKHVTIAKRKRTKVAKNINALRNEAIHIKGYSLALIYPLKDFQLSALIDGDAYFNEFDELVFS
ncbi:hypothetical protein [Enterobacter pseudoroggenkampii]|uniref:hypothetical protein n=1 Tax=Enterobacter pseudoroggenkampii TaxID=2996112 RepID=UPI00226467B4|nr:hypothetical protein [Enterobacter pseudoroggenkampii]MCX8289123.1 hypothetical protein [Enterobacter pseudoroggenkampii]